MKNSNEIRIINVQYYTLFLSLLSLLISIIITYNQKEKLEGKNSNLEPEILYNVTLFNRVLIVIISLIFLYVNIKLFNISKKEGENLKPYKLLISASIFSTISGLIALYVVFKSSYEGSFDVENPII